MVTEYPPLMYICTDKTVEVRNAQIAGSTSKTLTDHLLHTLPHLIRKLIHVCGQFLEAMPELFQVCTLGLFGELFPGLLQQ